MMVMHVTARAGCTDTVREPILEVGWLFSQTLYPLSYRRPVSARPTFSGLWFEFHVGFTDVTVLLLNFLSEFTSKGRCYAQGFDVYLIGLVPPPPASPLPPSPPPPPLTPSL